MLPSALLLATLSTQAGEIGAQDHEHVPEAVLVALDQAEVQLRAEVRETWAALAPLRSEHTATATATVEAFLKQYDGAEVSAEGHTRPVHLAEVEEARSWLGLSQVESTAPAPTPSYTTVVETRPLSDEPPSGRHLGLALEPSGGGSFLIIGPEYTGQGDRVYGQVRLLAGRETGEHLTELFMEELPDRAWLTLELRARLAWQILPDHLRLGAEVHAWDVNTARPEEVAEAIYIQGGRGVAAGPYLAGGLRWQSMRLALAASWDTGVVNDMWDSFLDGYERRDHMTDQVRVWADASWVLGEHGFLGAELGRSTIIPSRWVRDQNELARNQHKIILSLRAGVAL